MSGGRLTFEEKRARGEEVVAALNARDFDAIDAMDAFDSERAEFRSTIAASEGDTYVGVDGLRAWAANVDETWEDFHIEVVRVEEADENRVVAELRATGIARGSRIPLDLRTGQVWTWENGAMIRNDSFPNPAEAFEFAGVPYEPSTRSR